MNDHHSKLEIKELLTTGQFDRLGSEPHWRKVEHELGISTHSGERALFDGIELGFSKTGRLERLYSTRFMGQHAGVEWMGLCRGMKRETVENLLRSNGIGFGPFENEFPAEALERIITEGGVQLGFHDGALYDLLKVYSIEPPKRTISCMVSEEVYEFVRDLAESSGRSMGDIVAQWTKERLSSMKQ